MRLGFRVAGGVGGVREPEALNPKRLNPKPLTLNLKT